MGPRRVDGVPLRRRADGSGATSRRDLISTQLCAGAATLFGREAIPTVAAFRILRAGAAGTFARLLVALVLIIIWTLRLASSLAVLALEAFVRVTTIRIVTAPVALVGAGFDVAVVFIVVRTLLLAGAVLAALREARSPRTCVCEPASRADVASMAWRSSERPSRHRHAIEQTPSSRRVDGVETT